MVSGKAVAALMLVMAVVGGLASFVLNAVDAGPHAAALTYVGVAALGGMLAAQLVLRAERRDPHA
jgi:hypothetical protein